MNITWITLKIKNINESKKFYKEFFNLELEKEFSPYEGMKIAFLKDKNGFEIELIEEQNKELKVVDSNISIGIAIKNFDETYNEFKLNNFNPSDKVKMPNGMECFFVIDLDGVKIQVIREESLR